MTWLLLTKRPRNIGRMALGMWKGPIPGNVHLGTGVAGATSTHKIQPLLNVPGGHLKFLSLEPLLGPVHLYPWIGRGVGWVIVGGESGPNALPCDLEWIWDVVQQCREYEVPVFVKQLGENTWLNGTAYEPGEGKRDDPAHWPAELRVQEFPS